MGKVKTSLCLAIVLFVLGSPAWAAWNENGVLVETARVLTGASTGTKYYGYSGGAFVLPTKDGGVLSFDLWNDITLSGTSAKAYFKTEIAGRTILVENYAIRSQIREPYVEEPGWGAAGTRRLSLSIPSGVDRIQFETPKSETGLEISNIRFSAGSLPQGGAYSFEAVRDFGEPLVEAGRVLKGKVSGTRYYGYTGGQIHLPHDMGGFLSFKVWNDQNRGMAWALNKITVIAGTKKDSFEQYTTSLDLSEFYAETDNDWGPAGGGEVTLQLPEGITSVQFDGAGSMTGIEISDLSLTKGAPVVISFREKRATTTRVLVDLGRIFTGAKTGRKFYGYAAGTIILPSNTGGTLRFRLWNDHPGSQPSVTNRILFTAAGASQTFTNASTLAEKAEAYVEDSGWGPSGGREYVFQVPAGTGLVEVRGTQLETGFELSDLSFTAIR